MKEQPADMKQQKSGAGAAGASSAYFLSRYAKTYNIPINITVFERNDYIGGRSTTVNVYDDASLPVELGASIFVQVNQILVDAAKEFNLSTSPGISGTSDDTVPGAALAIWNGQEFVVTQSGSSTRWWDIAKLFWKYGTAPLRTMNLKKATVGKFLTMYEAPVFPFESLTQAAQDVGLLAVTAATGEQYLRENGISGNFGKHIVQASTRVNYAQNMAHIHALEAMVCMATDGAMSVQGGNWRVFDKMLTASNATTLLQAKVTKIEKVTDYSFGLSFDHLGPENSNDSDKPQSQLFDEVILAAPFQFSDIETIGVPKEPDHVPYVQLHVTLFTSPHLLSPTYFNLPIDKAAPRVILTTLLDGEPPGRGSNSVGSPGFFSISILRPIKNPRTGAQEYLYKIFSPEPANAIFLSNILGLPTTPTDSKDELSPSDVTWIYRKVWDSYPYEYPRVTFEETQLAPGFWYTSGMDSFISTMETNALMGMNVARLLVDRWLEGTRVNASIALNIHS